MTFNNVISSLFYLKESLKFCNNLRQDLKDNIRDAFISICREASTNLNVVYFLIYADLVDVFGFDYHRTPKECIKKKSLYYSFERELPREDILKIPVLEERSPYVDNNLILFKAIERKETFNLFGGEVGIEIVFYRETEFINSLEEPYGTATVHLYFKDIKDYRSECLVELEEHILRMLIL